MGNVEVKIPVVMREDTVNAAKVVVFGPGPEASPRALSALDG
uniref:Uncharacterized protein n=1 Tax=Streptomyces olivoviridis TaxID=67338 RepID=A0A455VJD4_9ACTN|nr:hypothetical protein [Streptomyces olivoviridis]